MLPIQKLFFGNNDKFTDKLITYFHLHILIHTCQNYSLLIPNFQFGFLKILFELRLASIVICFTADLFSITFIGSIPECTMAIHINCSVVVFY